MEECAVFDIEGAEIGPRESPQHHDRCHAACCGRLAVAVTPASLTGTNANALCLPFGYPGKQMEVPGGEAVKPPDAPT